MAMTNEYTMLESEPLSSPSEQTGTSVLERPETSNEEQLDDGSNSERFAHYVSADKLAESRATGRPVIALCGKVWIPRQIGTNHPICPECKQIFASMGSM